MHPPQDAPTFVSLNPCLDALLVELADPAQILALSHYSRDPASSSLEPGVAERFAVTGGTAEEVLALDPDIVLASSFTPAATRRALERFGVRFEAFGVPSTPQESYAQIERIARLTGQEQRAASLVERIEAALREASEQRANGGPIDALLWQSGEIVAGEEALVTRALKIAGFYRGGASARYQQGERVSLEQIVTAPPELLLVAGQSRGQLHPVLSKLPQTRTEPLDPSTFYCGGPSLIALTKRLGEIREGMGR